MIREIVTSDIPKLKTLPPKQWNFDYEDFLSNFLHEDFFYGFIDVQKGNIVSTGNILIKNNVAWLANIIVHEHFRRRGFGHSMTKFLVNFINEKRTETQLLIATDLGAPVYSKLGFVKTSIYLSFETVYDSNYTIPNSIRPLQTNNMFEVCSLDLEANGEDRKHLIEKFNQNGYGFFNSKDELSGFYLPEFGRGLVVSRNKESGLQLLQLKHAKAKQRTLVPIENQIAINFLKGMRLKENETSARMMLGKDNQWKPSYIYSYGSGYCG